MKLNPELLTLCIQKIEAKASLGDSQYWTNAEFETLSEKILQKTGTSLSASTLKRLWGRVKYQSTPQTSTLNALAQYIGFDNFWAFQQAQSGEVQLQSAISDNEVNPSKSRLSSSLIWSIGVAMGFLVSLLLAFSLSRDQHPVSAKNYRFSSQPVSEGIPNSVVFQFDVRQAPSDCLQIQQSWNEALRFNIKKDQQVATSIYYYPGFFRAKLLVDQKVVKEHPLYIKTRDWLPMVERDPIPVYFSAELGRKEGYFGLTPKDLETLNIALQPEVPWISYFYVKEMGEVSGDNFKLETSIKNDYQSGSGACQKSMVIVMCENTMMAIPFSLPGCVSTNNVFIAEKQLMGTENDLSKFGVNLNDWVPVQIYVKQKEVFIKVDGNVALTTRFEDDPGKVIGLAYRFQGAGFVDYVRLYNQDSTLVYREEFER